MSPSPSSPERELVELQSVSKIFVRPAGDLKALDDVSFVLPRAAFVAVTGPSGSGKSTLLNLIGCLDSPSHGRILLEGDDVSRLADGVLSRVRNRRIGFLFQSFNLIPQMDLLENVETALLYSGSDENEWRARSLSLLEELGLEGRARHRPTEVSGGEAQRAALARALVNDPDLILADEPTGNLDSATGARVLDLLAGLVERGKTLVLVTHDLEVAARAPRRLELKDGRLVADYEQRV